MLTRLDDEPSQFDLIYKAAILLDDKLLAKALDKFNVIDFEDNSLGIGIRGYVPVLKLASEGKHDAVKFLLSYRASKKSAIYGYAMGGYFDEVREMSKNEILSYSFLAGCYAGGLHIRQAEEIYLQFANQESKQKAISNEMGNSLLFSTRKFNEVEKLAILSLLKNQTLRISMSTCLNARDFLTNAAHINLSIEKRNITFKQTIEVINNINLLIDQYKINLKQAIAILDPTFNLLLSSEKSGFSSAKEKESTVVELPRLPLEVFFSISKLAAPVELTQKEVEDLYQKIYLPRFKGPLVNQLKRYSLFKEHNTDAKNLQKSCENSTTREQLFNAVAAEKSKIEKKLINSDSDYQQLIEKHYQRLK